MVGHICKHGMLRKCSSSRCGFCRSLKKKPDDVRLPSREIDKFNENISMVHVEVMRDCRSLIKKQSKLIDELFLKINNLNYQQKVLFEVTKRAAMAMAALQEGDTEKADHLLDSVQPMMEEAFVFEETENDGKKESKDKKSDEEGSGEDSGPSEEKED